MPTAKPSNSSKTSSTLPPFSHLYIEKEVVHHPLTRQIANRFSRACRVEIESYGELTQPRSAVWSYQKRTPKLILAQKKGDLLYPCSEVAPDFGHPHFYYAVPMQNCLYDCEYCYLQGMYNSAHLVLFVNQEEMIEAVKRKTEELGELYLCIAYDNDLLAFEGIAGLVHRWVEGLRDSPATTVEVRTKSANFRTLAKHSAPARNVLLAWTLSPPEVARRFEAMTPPVQTRLESLLQAAQAGWRVRLCLDPLLPVRDWEDHYRGLLKQLDACAVWDLLEDVCYGAFRMNKDYLRRARRARPESTLLLSADQREQRGLYTLAQNEELMAFMRRELQQRMPSEKVWQT